MAKTIEITNNQLNQREFNNIKPHTYEKVCRTTRKFKYEEKWLIDNGSVKIKDLLSGQEYIPKVGSIILFPINSHIQFITGKDSFTVRHILTDENRRNEMKVNMMVNYKIIEIIINALGKYFMFINLLLDSTLLFEGAKEGNIFAYYDTYNDVKRRIKDLKDAFQISESIWFGESRLYTGLKYVKKGFIGNRILENTSQDFINEIINEEYPFEDIINNPLGLIKSKKHLYIEGMHDLENLLMILMRSLQLKDELSPKIKKISRPESWAILNENELPHCVIYGDRIKKVIKNICKVSIAIQ